MVHKGYPISKVTTAVPCRSTNEHETHSLPRNVYSYTFGFLGVVGHIKSVNKTNVVTRVNRPEDKLYILHEQFYITLRKDLTIRTSYNAFSKLNHTPR